MWQAPGAHNLGPPLLWPTKEIAMHRRSTRRSIAALSALVSFVTAAGSHASLTPAQQCQAGKNRVAGKYAACRQNAEAGLATSGDTTKYGQAITKCTDKFVDAWLGLEEKAVKKGATCPSMGDATNIGDIVTDCTTNTAATLVGGIRFEDNGDGTVTDHRTGLQWEKKDSAGGGANFSNPHDVNNTYTWNTTFGGTTPNGTAFTDFLAKLTGADDGTCFANKCDWRLPTIEELQTILLAPDPCFTNPCIDPVFGPTISSYYWSTSTFVGFPDSAHGVYFANGFVGNGYKNSDFHVRAVRNGP